MGALCAESLPRIVFLQERQAFRAWVSFLADAQYFAGQRPKEINDCAALVRYAYREALRTHDAQWASRVALAAPPPLPGFPARPIDPRFDQGDGRLGHFADAKTLMRHNTRLVSREWRQALPGDLLFFHQPGQAMPYHVMMVAGRSVIDGRAGVVVYHTGPANGGPGEIRRLTLAELLKHPEPRWRPTLANPSFLGVYRWKLISDPS
jgi:uncharacterized protein YfaT (DUF1175 family)